MTDSGWSQEEYCRYLNAERRAYAWTLSELGGFTADTARSAAVEQYPYLGAADPYRGLVFHHESWHWAMLRLHGDRYWEREPGLLHPPSAYEAAWEAGLAEDPATAILTA
ncbi:hypothetical protein [Cellulomonas sp. NPDC089187]|uniref:hypothetical protein n=1 Tax=Cellulomonas sp. NPDC089187 TaxID=3154970 RepID=UPI0034121229